MGNILSSVAAFALSVTASVFALRAWADSEGTAKKWLGWGGLVLLIPAVVLLVSIVLILFFGVGLLFVRAALGISILTLVIGAAFVVYGTIALNTKEDKTEEEEGAVRDAIIASLVSGIGAFVLVVGFIVKLSSKRTISVGGLLS